MSRAAGNMHDVARLARLAQPFVAEFERVRAAAGETSQ